MLAMSGGSITYNQYNQSIMTDEDVLRGGVVVDEASSFHVSGTVSITDNADGDLLPVGPKADEIMTVTTTSTPAELNAASRRATLVGAWYDADGRLLGVAVQPVTVANGTSSFTLSRPAAAANADSCRVFLLGSGLVPLCSSKTASRKADPTRASPFRIIG